MSLIKNAARNHGHKLFFLIPIVILFGLVFYAVPARVKIKTELSVQPAGGAFILDTEIQARVMISTAEQINAVEAEIHFPPNILEVARLSSENSILSLWIQEGVFSNQKGTISFMGGLPTPGFSGTGEILSIYFRPKRGGWASIELKNAEVWANDGAGTPILDNALGAAYLIKGRVNPFPDLNNDGTINVIDVGIFLSGWGFADIRLDFNEDGTVNVIDFAILLSSVGQERPPGI